MKGKFKRLRPHAEAIMQDYLYGNLNMSEIADKYRVHYSNLRRFIKYEIKERGLEESFHVQYFNVDDFRWLDIGDTFQFGEELTIWRVTKVTEKENDKVFELVPTPSRNIQRHWINDKLVTGYEA